MTIENEKHENTSDNDADTSAANEKTNKVAKKLKKMGVMSSEKNTDEPEKKVDEPEKKADVKEPRRISPLLIMLLVAVPAAGVVVYMNMPDYIDNLLSSVGDFKFISTASDQQSPATVNAQSAVPVNPAAGRLDRPEAAAGNQSQEPQWMAQQRVEMEKRRLEFQKRNPEPEWVAQRRAEMEKGHLAYQKQNPEPEWMAQRRAEMEKRRLEMQKQNPQPEWIAQQRAEMEKRQLAFQTQHPDNYPANWRRPSVPPEPPQWVKDRQAEMQQEMARHQQYWANHSNGAPYNSGPGYMQNPAMNSYQPNGGNINNPPQGQYYNRQPNPYYNGPRNGFGPNRAPYGYPY